MVWQCLFNTRKIIPKWNLFGNSNLKLLPSFYNPILCQCIISRFSGLDAGRNNFHPVSQWVRPFPKHTIVHAVQIFQYTSTLTTRRCCIRVQVNFPVRTTSADAPAHWKTLLCCSLSHKFSCPSNANLSCFYDIWFWIFSVYIIPILFVTIFSVIFLSWFHYA